ncbi:hypothetical protein GCM10009760_14990 [Kitasatospora kazusensis]|uniref:FXSXX-COOH protein n=1 Tax=Kitasatospora kazusensis TaxID=407974 RepID=A0ABN2Z2Z2_9ACTN
MSNFESVQEIVGSETDLSLIAPAQLEVLAHLSPEEVETIKSVKARLEAAAGDEDADVEAHTVVIGGVLF